MDTIEERNQKEIDETGEQTDNEKKKEPKKKTLRNIILIILLLLLLLLLLKRCSDSDIKNGSITFQNTKEVTESLNEKADASNFILLANTNITVTNGMADIMVENSDSNLFACVIDVFIDDTKVYTSETMQPGSYIDKVDIPTEGLSKGVHNGTTVFQVINSDGSIRSNMSVETTVTIK